MVIPIKQLPNISPLVYDYFYNYNKVSEFYNGNFRNLAEFQNQTERVQSRILPREQLVAILKRQNRIYRCGSQTLENINKLIRNQTCGVVTGQQVGLFSGPLYTIYKALTVIRLTEYLNQNCNGEFVPFFWLASDDHDYAEINHIRLLNKNNHIENIEVPSPSTDTKIPASKIFLSSEIENCIRQLQNATHHSEFKQEMISILYDIYRPGRSFPEAFAIWMTQLFKSYGLIFIDASHPDLKVLGKRVFYTEIAENSPSTNLALKTSKKLENDKYHSQIQLHKGILNLFVGENERQTIQFADDDFINKSTQQSYKKDELLALLEKKAELFSPNVMLRPIYQDALLPTVAYVGGPSEIAYFAQLKGVYESFGLSMPIIYPRKTVTIIEKKIERVLKNYHLKIQELWQNGDGLINEMTKKQIPSSIDKVMNLTKSHLDQDFQSIRQELIAFEPTLENSVNVTTGKITHQVKFLEKKILQASKKRNEIVIQQFHKMKNNLYPNNILQERVFNIVPFLIKYSFDLIDKLYSAIDSNNHNHQIINL